jgi:hypothetical protein
MKPRAIGPRQRGEDRDGEIGRSACPAWTTDEGEPIQGFFFAG